MKLQYEGMTIAQYDFPPVMRIDLLNQMQDLLVEYGNIDKVINLENFIDNSFVEEAVRGIKQLNNDKL